MKISKLAALTGATLLISGASFAGGEKKADQKTPIVTQTVNTPGAANTNGDYRRGNIDPNRTIDRATIPEETMTDARTNVPAETTTLTEHTPTKVKEVQRALDSRGFAVGSVDGIWGSQTRSALKQFQSSNGLEASGELNDETFNALGITSERAMDDEMYSE